MYRTIISLLMLVCAIPVLAQGQAETKTAETYFMEVVSARAPQQRASVVTLDYGRLLPQRLGIRDEDLRKAAQSVSFSSVVDALNYLSSFGWKLLESYTLSGPAGSSVHFVMMIESDDPKAVADIVMGRR